VAGDGRGDGVAVRDAATVVLLADSADGVTVYLQRRPAGMAFGAGLSVFPGGAAEASDADLAATAVRETAEETGVVLAAEDLVPLARWLTPPGDSRRYDTRFYLAAAPPGADPRPTDTEAVDGAWVTPRRALAQYRAGRREMWPPTLVTLADLAAARRVATTVAAARTRAVDLDLAAPVDPHRHGRLDTPPAAPDLAGAPGRWAGGPLGAYAQVLLAPNPSPMTLDGTNTYLLGVPGAPQCVVVDPGPDDPGHRAAVLAAVAGRTVTGVLLTHRHADHAAGAAALAGSTGAPVWPPPGGAGASAPPAPLGLGLRALAVPGHTADSLAYLVAPAGLLLTGDTVLGRGTAFVDHPDGRVGDYLDSLAALADLVSASGVTTLGPGHGPPVQDPREWLAGYAAHRAARLARVALALSDVPAGRPVDREALLDAVYPGVAPGLRGAARASLAAQLAYLDA